MEIKEVELDQKDRLALLVRRLPEKKRALIVIFEGSSIPGIQSAVSRLTSILDPRHFQLYHTPDEKGHKSNLPFLYEYWNVLPQMGDVTMIDRSHYYKLALTKIKGDSSNKKLKQRQQQIADFETTLVDNGYLIYKFYFDLPKKKLKEAYVKEKKINKSLPKFLKERYKTSLKYYKKFEKIFNELRNPEKLQNKISIPWHLISVTKKKEVRSLTLQYLIDSLEKDLGIDSVDEVKEFDKAMDHVRSLNKRVS